MAVVFETERCFCNKEETAMLHISFSNVVVPVLFALAAAFYAKLGYMAFFGCSDGKSADSLLSEFEGKFKDLSEKLTELQDKIIDKEKTDKERIDLIKKDTEMLQLDGVTAGCQKKGNSNKETFTTGILLALLILQVCFIFGARRVYRRTKELEKEILKLKAKQ